MPTVTIEISERLEQAIRARADGATSDLSDLVLQLVEQSVSAPLQPDPGPMAKDDWLEKFRAWVASRPAYGVVGDFRRESIYEGRGE